MRIGIRGLVEESSLLLGAVEEEHEEVEEEIQLVVQRKLEMEVI